MWIAIIVQSQSPYFQHAHFIPIVGVGKRGEYSMVSTCPLHTNSGCGKERRILHGDLPRQHPFGTTSRFTGPVPADSRH